MATNTSTQAGTFASEEMAVLDAVSDEVVTLHFIWRNYRQLFDSEEKVAFLNSAVPSFGNVMQRALLHEVVLYFSKLTDPASSGKNRENLSLHRLRGFLGAQKTELTDKIDHSLKEMAAVCEVLRMHRNKRIAHADLAVALEKETTPGYSRQSIEHALKHLRELMNGLNQVYKGCPLMYEEISAGGDAEVLS